MADHDDRLPDELREYYRQLALRPTPDVSDRVMRATHAWHARLWVSLAGGLVALGAVAAVIVVALVNHGTPTGVAPAHTPTAIPSSGPTQTAGPTASAPVVQSGPPTVAFVPSDVTAISASEWWVLGHDTSGCAGVACTRVLHTVDGGHSFQSVPPPSVAPPQGAQQPHLRFANTRDGWAYDGSASFWTTHDGGSSWNSFAIGGTVTDLEASGGVAVAVVCTQAPDCGIERTTTGADEWTSVPLPSGVGGLRLLNIQGSHLWAAVAPGGSHGGQLLTSNGLGESPTFTSACDPSLGFGSLSAVSATVVWAICPTGSLASASRSLDGQHLTSLPFRDLPNFATIAGVSSTTAVIGAQQLVRTTDGGQTFTTVESQAGQWMMVGFTTPVDGFAFDLLAGTESLWRTDDAGAHWHQVQFP